MAFRRDEDLAAWLKNNWWLIIVLLVGVGFWLNTPLMHQTGSDSVRLPGVEKEAGEQSLRSLDAAENPQGAPGSSLNVGMPGRGAYARRDSEPQGVSSLFQGPGAAAGASLTGEESASPAAGRGTGDSLAAALKRVSDSASKSSSRGGWGNQAVHTGFSAPRANFGQLPSRSGGGSSSASAAAVNKPFGLGGNPGLVESRAPDLKDAKVSSRLGQGGGNQNLDALKSMEKASASALLGNTERAANIAQKSFDAAGAQSKSLAGMPNTGGVGMGEGEDVPTNLKAADYSKLDKKEITPPPIASSSAVKPKDNNAQMMMMMMMMMMGGMLGPSFSAMAPAMMMGMSAM
ncbi:MAG: hypothetical protein HY922_13355 [Elusimicrobia bacterium]|nr:hypothetical protein [Elusimicrobiota bacterium]